MCLGIPGQITEKWIDSILVYLWRVSIFGGVGKEICLSFEPDAQMNDYVLVHVGFAISRIDESEAQQTLELLRQMGELEAELNVV